MSRREPRVRVRAEAGPSRIACSNSRSTLARQPVSVGVRGALRLARTRPRTRTCGTGSRTRPACAGRVASCTRRVDGEPAQRAERIRAGGSRRRDASIASSGSSTRSHIASKQLGLVPEVPVDRAARHARLRGDLGERRAARPLAPEHVFGGVEQRFRVASAASFFVRRGHRRCLRGGGIPVRRSGLQTFMNVSNSMRCQVSLALSGKLRPLGAHQCPSHALLLRTLAPMPASPSFGRTAATRILIAVASPLRCRRARGRMRTSAAGRLAGFPPAEVTTLTVQPRPLPGDVRVRRPDGSARRRPRCARASPASSRSGCIRKARWVKAGQPLFQIDPKPLPGAARLRRSRGRARAGREVAQPSAKSRG